MSRTLYCITNFQSVLRVHASELQRLQAEFGSRYSFREAARLMEAFLPRARQLNTTVRNRLGRIAETLKMTEVVHIDTSADAKSLPLTVFLDGAHIRCRPECEKRHLDVVVGKIENSNMCRHFSLVQQAAKVSSHAVAKWFKGARLGRPEQSNSDLR